MRALEIIGYGTAVEALRLNLEAPTPDVPPDGILVRNHAVGVNPIDIMKRQGYGRALFEPLRRPRFPWVIGSDAGGVVEAVGSRVRHFKPGDAVYGAPSPFRPGTYAEYAVFTADELARKPANLDFAEAAALPYAVTTTWAALVDSGAFDPRQAAGKTVLVLGGAGGIGTFAVQLFKAWGCRVAATCSTRNLTLLAGLGVDQAIDYTTQDFTDAVRDVDLVYDLVGNDEARAISVLRRGGQAAYVTLVHPALSMLDGRGLAAGGVEAAATLAAQKCRHLGIRYHWGLFRPSRKALEVVRTYVEARMIRPVVTHRFPVSEAVAAHALVETGHAQGKVILTL